jgi:hypothetical protein
MAALLTNVNARLLKLVAPAASDITEPADVALSLKGDILEATFNVRSPAIYAREKLGPGEFPYQFDVVELFIAFDESRLPYFEFEVSPYNESFVVKVNSPRKSVVENFPTSFTHAAEIVPGGWRALLQIPLKELGWNGDPKTIIGNAYAIVGERPRTYWALTMPQQKEADFHQPQFFSSLFEGYR